MEERLKRERRKFDKQFKLDAVRLVTEGGKSAAAVARDLGIDATTLYGWKRDNDAFPGHGRLLPEDEERRRLERDNAALREENAILKKAMGYFVPTRREK